MPERARRQHGPLPEVEDAANACILSSETYIDLGPTGDPYFTESTRPGVRVVGKPMPGLSEGGGAIASAEGSAFYEFDAEGRHLRTRDADTGAVLVTFAYDATGRLLSQTDGDGNTVTIERGQGGRPQAIVGPFGARTELQIGADGMLSAATDPENATSTFGYGAEGLLTGYTEPGGKLHTFGYDADGFLTSDRSPDGETTTLSRTERSQGHAVTLTSNLGRSREYVVERRDGDEVFRRVTNTAGDATESTRRLDGTMTVTQPDGSTADVTPGGDPRFGMQSPFAARGVIRLPSGRQISQTTKRSATLATPGDPTSLTSKSETTVVNGKTSSLAYASAAKRYTSTSPTGRQWKVDVDTKGPDHPQ